MQTWLRHDTHDTQHATRNTQHATRNTQHATRHDTTPTTRQVGHDGSYLALTSLLKLGGKVSSAPLVYNDNQP
jgi:hypothetical protein